MSDQITPAPAKTTDRVLRQQLMRIGGTLTMVMAGANITPEELAVHTGVPEADVLKVLTGSTLDISVAQFAKLAGTLGVSIVLGAHVPPPQPMDEKALQPVAQPAT